MEWNTSEEAVTDTVGGGMEWNQPPVSAGEAPTKLSASPPDWKERVSSGAHFLLPATGGLLGTPGGFLGVGGGAAAGKAAAIGLDYAMGIPWANQQEAGKEVLKEGVIGAGTELALAKPIALAGQKISASNAVKSAMGSETADAVRFFGAEPTLAQETGSTFLRKAESMLGGQAFSAGKMAESKEALVEKVIAKRDSLLAMGDASGDAESIGRLIREEAQEILLHSDIKDAKRKQLYDVIAKGTGTQKDFDEAVKLVREHYAPKAEGVARKAYTDAYEGAKSLVNNNTVLETPSLDEEVRKIIATSKSPVRPGVRSMLQSSPGVGVANTIGVGEKTVLALPTESAEASSGKTMDFVTEWMSSPSAKSVQDPSASVTVPVKEKVSSLFELRRRLNDAISSAIDPATGRALPEAVDLKKLHAAVSKDIYEGLSATNPEAAKAYKVADALRKDYSLSFGARDESAKAALFRSVVDDLSPQSLDAAGAAILANGESIKLSRQLFGNRATNDVINARVSSLVRKASKPDGSIDTNALFNYISEMEPSAIKEMFPRGGAKRLALLKGAAPYMKQLEKLPDELLDPIVNLAKDSEVYRNVIDPFNPDRMMKVVGKLKPATQAKVKGVFLNELIGAEEQAVAGFTQKKLAKNDKAGELLFGQDWTAVKEYANAMDKLRLYDAKTFRDLGPSGAGSGLMRPPGSVVKEGIVSRLAAEAYHSDILKKMVRAKILPPGTASKIGGALRMSLNAGVPGTFSASSRSDARTNFEIQKKIEEEL